MASWLLLSRIISFAASIALPLILVRLLDPHTFGLYKQVFLVVNSALMYLPLGVGMSAFYFLARNPEQSRETVLNILLFLSLVGLAGGLVLILHPSFMVVLTKENETMAYAPWVGALVMLYVVGAFFEVITLANREVQMATVVILGNQISRTALMLGAALLFGTIQSVVWAAILQGVLQVSGLLIYVTRKFPGFWQHWDAALLGRQLSYAVPLGLANMLWSLQNDLHNYFVSHWFGAIGFAVYSNGCFQLPLINMLHESAASVLIPQIAQLQKEGRGEEILSLTLRAMRKISIVAFAAYGFLTVMGYEVIRVLFTDQYVASWPIFLINLGLIPLSMILTDPVVRAYADLRHKLLQVQCGLFAVLVVLLWWATDRFGMLGAISSTVGMVLVYRLCVIWLYGQALGLSWRHVKKLASLGKLLVSAVVAGVGTAGFRWLLLPLNPLVMLVVCGVFFTLVYALVLYRWDIVEPEEVADLRRMVNKGLRWTKAIA
jgi:O-antigen/teichoic acid export membrane protein